jgi:hypothetical protein
MMWVLVTTEAVDLDVSFLVNFVARDKSRYMQLLNERVDVDLVVRENINLESLGAIFEASFAVGTQPQSSEAQACLVS